MKDQERKKGALSGILVLDLTRVLAGPFCTMLLGDMGAEIIKIETPGAGDDSRRYPPFIGDDSAYFMNLNRNKKSITLNLKADEGKKVFFDLTQKADVIIENFRPGTMEKLGSGIGNNKLWREFCKVINDETLLNEEKYRDNADRVKHHQEVQQIVEAWTKPKTVKEIINFLLARRIPCAPINTVKDIVEDEHIAVARGMFQEIEHPSAGKLKVVSSPVNMSATPPQTYSPAPLN